MKNRAFTLAECLIVVFVLLVIAAIIFPYFARARENARRSSCQSNLKQISLGMKQYTRDYDELFPVKHAPPNKSARSGPFKISHWVLALQPYLKSFAIFQCPSEPNSKGTDYYYNPYVSGRNETDIVDSAVFVQFTEGVDRSDCYKAIALAAQKTGATPAPFARHLEGSNYAFVDGHVKWLHSTKPPKDVDLTGGFTFRGRLVKVRR